MNARQLWIEFTLDGAIPTSSSSAIYGKRIIIMGAGAQVGQVALGAVRRKKVSDTIFLDSWGEEIALRASP